MVRCRIQFLDEFLSTESEGDSLDRLPYAVLAKWSFLHLKFLQIPLLTIFSITKIKIPCLKTKVSSNRSRQRKDGKPSSTNLLTPFKCRGKSAKSENFGQVCRVWGHLWSSPCKAADPDLCCGHEPKTNSNKPYHRSIADAYHLDT